MNPRQRARTEVLVHGVAVDEIAELRSERRLVRARARTWPTKRCCSVPWPTTTAKKDWPNLLAAVRILVDRGANVAVCAVGQGPLESEVVACRAELGLQDVVTLTGYRPDAVRLMAGCDIFVLGSKWEGLPVALMEASALGLPIVATRVGGIPDAFHDGVDAVLVPPSSPEALAAALGALVDDPARRLELGSAARARAGDFDITRGRCVGSRSCTTRSRRDDGRTGDAGRRGGRPPEDPGTAPAVDGSCRRRPLRSPVPLEASRQCVRTVADVGRV